MGSITLPSNALQAGLRSTLNFLLLLPLLLPSLSLSLLDDVGSYVELLKGVI
jgi:hypothetical protein